MKKPMISQNYAKLSATLILKSGLEEFFIVVRVRVHLELARVLVKETK